MNADLVHRMQSLGRDSRAVNRRIPLENNFSPRQRAITMPIRWDFCVTKHFSNKKKESRNSCKCESIQMFRNPFYIDCHLLNVQWRREHPSIRQQMIRCDFRRSFHHLHQYVASSLRIFQREVILWHWKNRCKVAQSQPMLVSRRSVFRRRSSILPVKQLNLSFPRKVFCTPWLDCTWWALALSIWRCKSLKRQWECLRWLQIPSSCYYQVHAIALPLRRCTSLAVRWGCSMYRNRVRSVHGASLILSPPEIPPLSYSQIRAIQNRCDLCVTWTTDTSQNSMCCFLVPRQPNRSMIFVIFSAKFQHSEREKKNRHMNDNCFKRNF